MQGRDGERSHERAEPLLRAISQDTIALTIGQRRDPRADRGPCRTSSRVCFVLAAAVLSTAAITEGFMSCFPSLFGPLVEKIDLFYRKACADAGVDPAAIRWR